MLIAVAAAIVVVVVTTAVGLFVFAKVRPLPQAAQGTAAPTLLGEAVTLGEAKHVTSAAGLQRTVGQPPAGGPHFAQSSTPGIYANPIEDGEAIHSLEHGMIWITYRPGLASARDIEILRVVAESRPNDVILSPRPGNASPASVVSWGRRLNLASPVSRRALEAFVATNVDQSPEPGVR